MTRLPLGRIAREIGLGALALAVALLVLVPALFVVHLLYQLGLYELLIATVGATILLVFFQLHLRPGLREPAMRARAGIVEALRGDEVPADTRETPSSFRVWGGVPIATLRVAVYEPTGRDRSLFATGLCAVVRERVRATAALTWAFSEVGGERFLLMREPESIAAPLEPLPPQYAAPELELRFHHLWSQEGTAGYEDPVAFATVLLARAIAGHEAELHRLAIEVGEQVAHLPEVEGVEVLMSEAVGTHPPYLLWLAAGRSRAVRRRVYLALEPSGVVHGHAQSVDWYELLTCEAYAQIQGAGNRVALNA